MKIQYLIWIVLLPLLLDAKTMVRGRVMNGNGEPLPFANVFLQKTLDGAMTNDEGTFEFSTEKEGEYTISIRYMGYEEWKTDISLEGKPVSITAVLKNEPIEMGGVTVKASSFTTGEEEGVTLTPLEVLSTPGSAADICWAIQSYPGVQQIGDGAGLFVRGGEVTETQFTLDGATIQHPYRYESPTGGFFGTFTPFLLKGTFFSSGGFSVLYGNSLSGVLAMKSLDPPVKSSLNLGIGVANLSAMGGVAIQSEKLGCNFSGNRSNTKTLFDLNRVKDTFIRYPFSYDINLNVGYRYSETGLAKFFLFRENDVVGITLDDPTWNSIYHGDGENTFVNVKVIQGFSEEAFIDANMSYTDFNGTAHIDVGDSVLLDISTRDRFEQGKIVISSPLFQKIRWGGEFKTIRTQYSGFRPETDTFDPGVPKQVFDTEYLSRISSGFAEIIFELNSTLSVVPGVRLDYESERDQVTHDERISLSWQPIEDLTFSGATGTFHQFAGARYYDPEYGNPQLQPLSAKHYILSSTYHREGDMVRCEIYYKDYDRLVRDDEVTSYSTDGYGSAKGLDLFLKKDLGRVDGRIAYSYLIAKRLWNDFPSLAPPAFDITHNLNVVGNVALTNFFSVGAKGTFATGKPYTPLGKEFHSGRIPPYYTIDLNLFYLHSFYPGNLSVFYLSINNVTGHTNILDYYNGDENAPLESSYSRLYYFGLSFSI
jgi:vitamin B12 transporter